MSEVNKLPKGWCLTTIPSLIAGGIFTDGDWVESKDQDPQGSVRLLQLADIGDGFFINKSNRFLNEETANYLNCTYLKANDVLVARMPDPLGRACLMPKIQQDSVTVVDVCVIRPAKNEHFSPSWLMHFINSPEFREKIATLQSGSTRKRISRGNLSKIELPFPPRAEQDRIVEKLDEVFSGLDSGIKELKATQIKLTQQRQSLLKSAVEGSLTQPWREVNGHNIQENGEQLLERILKKRRELWQQQKLAEFADKGKTPPKGWQDKYPEPVQPDTSELPALPDGWVWASVDQLVYESSYGTSVKCDYGTGNTPVLRIPNVINKKVSVADLKATVEPLGIGLNKQLLSGDILVVRTNGSLSLMGQTALVRDIEDGFYFASYLLRLRTPMDTVLPEWMDLYFGSKNARIWIENQASSSAGQNNISLSKLSNLHVPLASLEEQVQLITVLANEFDSIERQIEATALGLKQSEVQRKNILKSAFSGQLVPQDPNDEPASVLLEKIKLEREALAKTTKPRSPRQPKQRVDTMDTLLAVLTAEDSWIDAQDAFKKCGIIDGASTDRIEEIYSELRQLEKAGCIEIQRRGEYDQLKLIK